MIRVLTGATLIDGTGAAPVPDAAVVIEDGRVTAAGPRGALAWPADAAVIDARGRTVVPGLIDAHDHLASHGYALATRWGLEEPASTTHLRTARVLADTLAMGYTTVRDAGGLDAGFKLAVEQGLVPGPRLVVALQIISPTGGIGDRVSPSGHDCCGAYDPLLPDSVANGPDAVRDVVRRIVRAGADVIKTATTGGASSRPGHGPLDAAFSAAEMEALVTESHAQGRRVMCHALGGPGLRAALEAGVDSIEHGCYLDEDPTLLNRMAVQGTFFVPTLTVYVYHRESKAPHVRERSSWACPSRPAPTRAATAIPTMRSSSSIWSRPACLRCRRCGRPRNGPPAAWGSTARSAPSRRVARPTWWWSTATRSTTSRCCSIRPTSSWCSRRARSARIAGALRAPPARLCARTIFLPESEVAQDEQHHHHHTDDVEDGVHGCSFPAARASGRVVIRSRKAAGPVPRRFGTRTLNLRAPDRLSASPRFRARNNDRVGKERE